MRNKNKILLVIFVFLLGLAFFGISKTYAGPSENGSGWLWGGSEQTSDGTINGNETGLGWSSLNNTNTGGGTSYGVNIPTFNGNLSGYAWSENLGWISFESADSAGCVDPIPANCTAKRNGNNLSGFARILSIRDAGANAGGWQGWVRLAGTAQDGSSYGVSINSGNLSGYAWSDELGWIDFSRAIVPACVPDGTTFNPVSCTDGLACGACGASETTNPWICVGTNNCGGYSTGPQSACTGAGITCSDTQCPPCPAPQPGNWKEVAP